VTETSTPSDASAIDIFDHYSDLRRTRPVSRAEEDGPWQIARYAEVREVLKNHEVFSSDVAMRRKEDADRPPSMLFSDPPVHTRLRKLIGSAFSPRQIALQRELIETRCEQLVTQMCKQDQTDLIDELAAPLPVAVIAHMLGVPDGNIREFKRWSDAIFSNIGEILLGNPSREAMKAAAEMDAYFLEQIAELRRKSQPHLLGQLVHTETDAGKLSDAELLGFCRLLLIAGNETTTGLIVACVRVFHELPDTFARLKQAPNFIPSFVEETLRYYSPFQLTIRRATRDFVLGGVTIRKTDLVLPIMASANRDEDVFAGADRFLIDRDPNPHLAFGLGVHSCLGSSLARLEGQIAVRSLITHLDEITLADSDTRSLNSFGAPSRVAIHIRRAA
jgi:cytochrome P450